MAQASTNPVPAVFDLYEEFRLALSPPHDALGSIFKPAGKDELKLCFSEKEGDETYDASVVLTGLPQPKYTFNVKRDAVVVWGINFAGIVIVSRPGLPDATIYIPGTRT